MQRGLSNMFNIHPSWKCSEKHCTANDYGGEVKPKTSLWIIEEETWKRDTDIGETYGFGDDTGM